MTEATAVVVPTPIAQLYRQMWLHAQGACTRLLGALALQLGSQALKLALPWLAAQAINAIQTGGPLLALWWLSALTGSLALAGFVAIGVAVMGFDRRLMALAGAENHAERRYAARMLDYIGNISALASLRLQGATRVLLGQRLAAVFEPLSRSIVLTEWKWCTVDLATVILGWVLVMVYAASGAGSVAGATLLIGNLFMVHQYAQQAAGVLCSVAANYQGLARKQADFASADIIQQAPQAQASSSVAAAAPADHGWQRITLHDLGYAHAAAGGDAPRGGIHGVTLELVRGERIALVGPSGSGKSTLLRVLAGLYEAEAGTVSIDGAIEPGRRHAAELATLIPQEAEVFEANVRENLTFGEPVDDAALARAVHASALDEVLAGLPQGLDTPMSERGFNLSGGQRQRLALARGVLAARGRTLLLLDEPTSALDPLIERHVHERIDRVFEGACIVASVHRLSLLPHFDRVVFMAGGRVVDVGTADALRARQPVFAAMCRGAAQPAETAPV